MSAIFKAAFSVLVLPNLVGNSLVVFVILRSPAMKSPMNYLLLNLAASDLLVGFAMIPRFYLEGAIAHLQGEAADFLCRIIILGNLGWIAAISSIYSLVLIAIERYHVIAKPLGNRHRLTNKQLRVFVPATWIAGAVFCFPVFYISHFDVDRATCVYTWPAAWYPHAYSASWLAVAGVLPTGVMTALYARVAYSLWSASTSSDVTLQAVRRSRRKVTVTMLALSVVYAVCWFPDLVMHVVSNAAPDKLSLDHPVHTVAICLVVVNSSVNPVVYAFRFDQFKREFRKIFCSCGSSNDRRTQSRDIGVFALEMNARHASVIIEAGPVRATRYTRVTTEPEQVTSTGNLLITPKSDNIPLATGARGIPEIGQTVMKTDRAQKTNE